MLSAADLNEPVDRRVMADALEDGGRYAEANLLRSLSDLQRVDIVFGEVVHVAIRVEMSDCIGACEYAIDGDTLKPLTDDTFTWKILEDRRQDWIGKDEKEVDRLIRSIYHGGEPGLSNHDANFALRVSLVPVAEAFRQ